MKLVRELFLEIARRLYGKTDFETRGHKFDLADEEGDRLCNFNQR